MKRKTKKSATGDSKSPEKRSENLALLQDAKDALEHSQMEEQSTTARAAETSWKKG